MWFAFYKDFLGLYEKSSSNYDITTQEYLVLVISHSDVFIYRSTLLERGAQEPRLIYTFLCLTEHKTQN